MIWFSLVKTFLRHAAYASVVLTVALTVLERLSPGSVLPYVPIAWLVIASVILCLVAPAEEGSNPLRSLVPLILWLALSVSAVLLMLAGAGQLRMLVVAAAVVLIGAAAWAFGLTPSSEEEYEH